MKIGIRLETGCSCGELWRRLVDGAAPRPLRLASIDEGAGLVEYRVGAWGISGVCRAWCIDDVLVIRCVVDGFLARLLGGRIRRSIEEWVRGLAHC